MWDMNYIYQYDTLFIFLCLDISHDVVDTFHYGKSGAGCIDIHARVTICDTRHAGVVLLYETITYNVSLGQAIVSIHWYQLLLSAFDVWRYRRPRAYIVST